MYNLRSKKKKEGQPHKWSEKTLRIMLDRIPLLENPSSHNCIFSVKNGEITNKKTDTKHRTKKIITFSIFVFIILNCVFICIMSGFHKDQLQTSGLGLDLFAHNIRIRGSFLLNSLYTKCGRYGSVMKNRVLPKIRDTYLVNLLYSDWKRYVSGSEKRKKSCLSEKRKDVCCNDIRDFIKVHWVPAEKERTKGALSFIEEQCRMVTHVPKFADYAFNDTEASDDIGINYASYDKGARILSTSGAEPYVEYKVQSTILQYILGSNYFTVDELSICGISQSLCRYFVTGAFSLLQPWHKPGDCWSFKGTRARVQIELPERIFITAVTLEHIPPGLATTENVRSAPAQFSLIGIDDTGGYKFTSRSHLGTYRYDLSRPSIQTFFLSEEDSSQAYKMVEFNVESNHGNKNYTCVYRLRVHGRPFTSIQ